MVSYADFAPTRRVTNATISPDGQSVAYIDGAGGSMNLYLWAGGESKQLTDYEKRSVRDVLWFPCGGKLLFGADLEGDELDDFFLVDLATGDVREVSGGHGPDRWLNGGCISPDGSKVYYTAAVPDPQIAQVWVYDVEAGEHTQLTTLDEAILVRGLSPDGKTLAAVHARGVGISEPRLVDVATGEVTVVRYDKTIDMMPVKAIDGQSAYAISDQGKEFRHVGVYDFSTKEFSEWSDEPHGHSWLSVSSSGRAVWEVNVDGYSRVMVRDADGTQKALSCLPSGVTLGLSMSADGKRVVASHSTATTPHGVYVIDVDADTCTTITEMSPRGVDPSELVEPTLEVTKAFDGQDIPMFVYRPQGEGPFPAVVYIHGGPQSQMRPEYNQFFQTLVARGIVVVTPNVRGSTGYGRSYALMVNTRWGIDDLKDFKSVRDFTGDLDEVDENRIAVAGRSYGGFASLSCVTRLPDEWACGVDIYGVSNLSSFYKTAPETWTAFLDEWVGNPKTQPEYFHNSSPVNHLDNVVCPLYVIQGAKDRRVVKAESDQVVEKLRARGVEVKYDVFEDEGHGFLIEANEIKAYTDISNWLTEQLKA